MKVFKVSAQDADQFEEVELPEPVADGHDLLVKVHAVSVNPVDTKVRRKRAGRVLGWDAAGEVVAVGAEVTGFKVGDAVYYAGALQREGTNAQLHLVHEALVAHKPEKLDWLEAAALPLTALTAWEGLFEQLQVPQSQVPQPKSLMVVNGGGGVGSLVIQLAKKLANVTVVATASRPVSSDWVHSMGADHVVDHRGDIPAQLQARGLPQVDYIFCCHDTARHFPALARAVAPQGHIVSIVETDEPLPLGTLFTKKASFSWEFMFTKAMFGTPDMASQGEILKHVAELCDAGTLRGTLTERPGELSATSLAQAHQRLESGSMVGKLALSVGQG